MFESSTVAWTVLLISGAFEAMWAAALGESSWSMRKRVIVFTVGTIVSMGGLYLGLTVIPVGAGYAAWVGVGAVAALAYSALRGRERLTLLRLFFVFVLIAGIVGLGVFS
ncbi:ligand-binding protein SH3 [Brevibacterium sp. HMSC08F02]|uniref:DMT family transporter n=1 Tax=Brevibacterium sp. HMSC08F02 TaxID=1581140 RepID=UPI0008A15B43|nr:SMR family transporter [Brevibacterium sp. HMSC08F02]OFT25245.1 ligand-binding protein SH3 [Brevibacterium sp. HMSC08F02]